MPLRSGEPMGTPAGCVRFVPLPPAPTPAAAPLPGWRPWSLEDGSWSSRFDGDTRTLPDDLVGRVIEVTTRGGETWVTRVFEVLEWTEDFVLFHDSGKG